MRTRGLSIIRQAFLEGRIEWEDGTPRLLACPCPDCRQVLQEDRQTLQAVFRRAAAFSRQLAFPSADPFLRFRDARWCRQGCPSCGVQVSPRQAEFGYRCDHCQLAADLVLAAPVAAKRWR